MCIRDSSTKRENGSKFTLKTSKQMSVPLKTLIHQMKFTKRLCNLKRTSVILRLFKNLHGTPEEDTITDTPGQSNHHRQKTGIINVKLLEIWRNDPKTSAEEIVQFCLLVIRNETKSREQLSSNGNVKSGCFIRQGLWLPQSAKAFSPARKHLIRTQLKMPKIW